MIPRKTATVLGLTILISVGAFAIRRSLPRETAREDDRSEPTRGPDTRLRAAIVEVFPEKKSDLVGVGNATPAPAPKPVARPTSIVRAKTALAKSPSSSLSRAESRLLIAFADTALESEGDRMSQVELLSAFERINADADRSLRLAQSAFAAERDVEAGNVKERLGALLILGAIQGHESEVTELARDQLSDALRARESGASGPIDTMILEAYLAIVSHATDAAESARMTTNILREVGRGPLADGIRATYRSLQKIEPPVHAAGAKSTTAT